MSIGWDRLPLLPITCILEHLSLDDALAAMSTCKHWRSAMLLYEGRRNTLKLKAKQLEKNLFLSHVFKKHAKTLHVYIDCNEEDLNKFMNVVMPQFFDSMKLKDVVFIGPIYMKQNPWLPYFKLKRIIMESFVYKHSKLIRKLAILGCEMSVNNENDIIYAQNKQVEFYAKRLTFDSMTSPGDEVLSRCNIDAMKYSSLKHIMFEYELISNESLETLSKLNNLKVLTLNVMFKKHMALNPIDWAQVNNCFANRLHVAVNLISVPGKKFKFIMDNVLLEGMPVISFKVLFCKTLYSPLVSHICRLYRATLREVVWADAPHRGTEPTRFIRMKYAEVFNQVNPFILLCWQCVNLRRLAIHGYWIWQYDLLGFIHLRKSVRIEVSSVYGNPKHFNNRPHQVVECGLRVLQYDKPQSIDINYIEEINRYAEYEWKPYTWRRLHPGLRNQTNPTKRGEYIVKEVLSTLGVT